MLTLNQIAEEAGVSYWTAQRWTKKGTPTRPVLPSVKFGSRTVRIRDVDWERFKRSAESRPL